MAPLRFGHFVQPGFGPEQIARGLPPKKRARNHALIVRRPSRILGSYFHHIKSNPDNYPDSAELNSVSEFIRSERYGIDRIIDYYRFFDGQSPAHRFVLYYEDLAANTRDTFKRLLEHAGYSEISEVALDYAIEQSRFERLQARERERRRAKGLPDDQNFLRFRVGAHARSDEVTAEDQLFIADRLRRANVGLFERYLD